MDLYYYKHANNIDMIGQSAVCYTQLEYYL